MKEILIIGAGRSTLSLITYLQHYSEKADWKIVVADQSLELAQKRAGNHPRTRAIALDVTDDMKRTSAISGADLVISMLPAHMHIPVARDCIALRKHMVTASYISKEMQELDEHSA